MEPYRAIGTPGDGVARSNELRFRIRGLARYAAALALVAGANGLAALAGDRLNGSNLAMLFLVPVLVTAVGFGLGPALLGAVAAAVTYNFFHLAPRYTFEIGHPADLLTFSMFFAVALATGWLAGRVRDHAHETAQRAAAVSVLLDGSRRLSAASTVDEASQALAEQAAAASGCSAVVLLPEGEGVRVAGGPRGLGRLAPPAAQAARRAWDGEPSDPGDETVGWTFRPLQGLHGRVGVIGLRAPERHTDPDAEELFAALLHQGAVALERAQLASAAAENEALRRADQLRSALLNSISHDFRTPLSTVLGSSTTLLEYEAALKPKVRRDLLESIREEAERLNRYVADLLDMSRLEAGALRPRLDWTNVRQVVESALARLGDRVGSRRIVRDFAPDLSRVKLDATLLEQALLNVLENALAYAPDGSRLEIAAYEDLDSVLIAIEDEGPGIPRDQIERVFDKFLRLGGPADRSKGLGLGLSIARGFIEAMGGRIAATSPVADGRGTRFLISLPKSVATPKDLL